MVTLLTLLGFFQFAEPANQAFRTGLKARNLLSGVTVQYPSLNRIKTFNTNTSGYSYGLTLRGAGIRRTDVIPTYEMGLDYYKNKNSRRDGVTGTILIDMSKNSLHPMGVRFSPSLNIPKVNTFYIHTYGANQAMFVY